MVSRADWPYLGVVVLGGAFVSFALIGLDALTGDPRFGTGFGRLVLYLFGALGSLAIVVASVDLYRRR